MEESKNLKVVVISRQLIKPSSPSPSPNNHETFKLSLLDQLTFPYYVPILLFYEGGDGEADKFEERSQHLKSSLSETLAHFYPFAGRLIDHLTFSCNDEGAEYSESQVLNYTLSDILEKPNPKHLSLFLPEEPPPDSEFSSHPAFMVKVSFFGCGGMVIGMRCCHKIADAATCATFIKGWANSALGNMNSVIPDFSLSSALFPPTDSLESPPQVVPLQDWPGARASRFVFRPSELAALQAKAARPNMPLPTRVEAVSSLLWKALLLAKKHSSPIPSAFMWAVNLRSRLQPPLPKHCFGNFVVIPFAVHQCDRMDEIDLPILAGKLKRGTIDIGLEYVKTLKGDDPYGILGLRMKLSKLIDKALTGSMNMFTISSWCKFPFYEVDFGWGKPVWATSSVLIPNAMMLMDARDGVGIEAWVYLMEEDMTMIESNQELKKFASFNPSALHY